MNIPGKIEPPRQEENAVDSNSRHEKLYRLRHSLAHIMAQATIERFSADGEVLLGGGPPIDDGFYYDFQLPRQVNDEDLQWIESRMKEIVRAGCKFKRKEVSRSEAEEIFSRQPFKLELIEAIVGGNLDDNGNSVPTNDEPSSLSVFSHSDFIDLCKGPHVSCSDEIDPNALKVLSVAGAYWRANERNPMLSRIYATAWDSEEELHRYLKIREEKLNRDHRKLGKKLELFHFDDSAPGMPYWLPNGLIVLNELISYWRKMHDQYGYKEFSGPLLNDKKLWEISGHWQHYKENMFLVPDEENDDIAYGLKPMNCPNAMVVYNLKLKSYRDLPFRLSDCDPLHRNERSGTMHGLLRVQKFQQDDAHIFLEPSQIEAEFKEIFRIADHFYKLFDLKYEYRLSVRPDKFVGEVEEWDEAEAILKEILDQHCGEANYKIAPGEGAFYGPKIDIMMRDCLDRSWQMGTIQLDFQLPQRFQCKYIDKDGNRKVPVVIHRVIYGSLDRFIGILIEHTGGNLPLWLAPEQVRVIPISADDQADYARDLIESFRSANLRVSLDDSQKSLNKRIREASMMRIPYLVIVGEKERSSGTLSYRTRAGEEVKNISKSEFLELLLGQRQNMEI